MPTMPSRYGSHVKCPKQLGVYPQWVIAKGIEYQIIPMAPNNPWDAIVFKKNQMRLNRFNALLRG